MDTILPSEKLRIRASVYRLFGAMFLAELSTETLVILRTEEILEILAQLAPSVDLQRLRHLVDSESFSLDDTRIEFHRLFSAPSGQYVFPYESCHRVADPPGPLMGPETVAVVNAYAEAGFTVAAEFTDAPDHFGVELVFLAELCQREADALDIPDTEAADRYARMRTQFCRSHLGPWAGLLAERITTHGNSTFYSELSLIVSKVVEAELQQGAAEA